MQGVQVLSLVGELRSHMPCGTVKFKNNGNINVEVISILTPKFNSRWKKAYIGG